MIWILGSLTALSALLLAVRLALKRPQGKPLCWDDSVLVGAWCFLLCSFALVAVAAGEGYGWPDLILESESESRVIRLLAAAEFCAVFALAAAKTSIAITLLYAMPERWQRVLVGGFLVLADVLMVGLACVLWVAMSQRTLAQICEAGGTGWPAVLFQAVWSAATDLIFAFIPWLFFPRNMRIRERIGLVVMVSLGTFAGVTAIIKIKNMGCNDLGQNIAHASTNQVLWTFIEPAAMILAICIPILHLLDIPRDGDSQLDPLGPNEAPFPPPSPSVSADGRHATWTITGGPFDPFDPQNAGIPLQPLGPAAHRTIVRTEAIVVEVEDAENVRARGRTTARRSFPL
ncbi:hypothetical protein C8A05DRAFT_37102 [Staphylotrichum tortipilum]|uniref:Rhodopsin domain-containing protein n=1 Tax=Staphylotrichum tortipilum TaxID=2831512 RepID=A0AAN6MFK1_9PEZI|nr:hypothetical protein C8A05DRAFT_37102 [Staphylotrichum longicolle]